MPMRFDLYQGIKSITLDVLSVVLKRFVVDSIFCEAHLNSLAKIKNYTLPPR